MSAIDAVDAVTTRLAAVAGIGPNVYNERKFGREPRKNFREQGGREGVPEARVAVQALGHGLSIACLTNRTNQIPDHP